MVLKGGCPSGAEEGRGRGGRSRIGELDARRAQSGQVFELDFQSSLAPQPLQPRLRDLSRMDDFVLNIAPSSGGAAKKEKAKGGRWQDR